MSEETVSSFCSKHGGVPTRVTGPNDWTGYDIKMRVDDKPVTLHVARRDSSSPEPYFRIGSFIAQLRGTCSVYKIRAEVFKNAPHIRPQSVNFKGFTTVCVPLYYFDEFASAIKRAVERMSAKKRQKKRASTLGGGRKIPPLKFHPVAEPQPYACASTLTVDGKLLAVPSPVLSPQHSRSASPELPPVPPPQDSNSSSPELPPVSPPRGSSSPPPELPPVSSLAHYKSASPKLQPALLPEQGTFKDVLSHNIPEPKEVFDSIVQTVRSQQLRLVMEARNGDKGKMRSCNEILSDILEHEKYLALQTSEWKDT